MSAFDASSILEAWDAYPIAQFPPFWEWMANLVDTGEIVLARVAYEEIGHKAPECREWLADHNCTVIDPDNEIVQAALGIKNGLGIVNDQYKAGAVDEADILIVATAKVLGIGLVSEESPQPTVPGNPANYRIPRVCQKADVDVECRNLRTYIKDSNHIFG